MAGVENYLVDNPPRVRQYYDVRMPPGWRGAVGMHTTESMMDTVGIDTGPNAVADFIKNRTDKGSYWKIGGSQHAVGLVPIRYTTFSIGVSGFNSVTLNYAFACRTTDLNLGHWWTQYAVGVFAHEIVEAWIEGKIDPVVANRWIEPEEVLAGRPGLINHGTVQPRDRKDMLVNHPQRAELQAYICQMIAANLGGPAPKEPDVANPPELFRQASGAIWLVRDGVAVKLTTTDQVDFALKLSAVNRMELPSNQTDLALSLCGVLPAAIPAPS